MYIFSNVFFSRYKYILKCGRVLKCKLSCLLLILYLKKLKILCLKILYLKTWKGVLAFSFLKLIPLLKDNNFWNYLQYMKLIKS